MNFTINDFEGPLDLLLHLVKTAKMDIYEIDTKRIIDDYIKYINQVDKKELDSISEYLVMAAELIHLKSRLLVNNKDEELVCEYEINTEEDLKNRLIEYEKYKSVCEVFKNFEEKRKDFYTKVPENLNKYAKEKMLSKDFTIDDLKNAFLNMRKREDYHKPIITRITHKELSVEDKTKYIKELLDKRQKVKFEDLFEDVTREELIVTFLSVLNMCKEDYINIYQKSNYDSIIVEGKNNE